MTYVKHLSINGIDTKLTACIELNGRPNAATEGAVGVLGMDMTSPTHEVYRCVAVNGSVYTWELLSAGMSIISATITGKGAASKSFSYSALLTPDNYLIKAGDLILDSEGYLYQISTIGNESCTATYCGTHIGGIASGDKDYRLVVNKGKLQLVTESGAVISNVDHLVPDGDTITRDSTTGEASVRGIYTIDGTLLRIFKGTVTEYNALTDAQKVNLFPIVDDRPIDIVQHETYYKTMCDFKTIYGDGDGALYIVSEGTTTVAEKDIPSTVKVAVLPTSLTSIGRKAFESYSSLTSVKIPGSVTSIGWAAFYYCSSLTSIEIPNGVTSIDSYTFCGCSSLTHIEIPDGVTIIEQSGLAACSSMTSVKIPNSVTNIEKWALGECPNLTDIYYTGTEEEWNAITFGESWNENTPATIHYNSKV